MKKRFQHVAFVAIISLTVGVGYSVTSQEKKEKSHQVLNSSNLTFKISTTKQDFVWEEPIPLIINLSNEKQEPVLGHAGISFLSPYLKVFILSRNGEKRRIENLSIVKAVYAVEPREIEPGERHQYKGALTLDLDKAFPESGEYQIQVVLAGLPGEIKSNILDIGISAPQGSDLAAYHYIKGKGEYAFILSGGDLSDSDKGRRDLEEFVSLYEQSAYGDYAMFSLGSLYFAYEEFAKAQQQFSKVASKSKFVYADEAKAFIDKIKKKQLDLSVANKP